MNILVVYSSIQNENMVLLKEMKDNTFEKKYQVEFVKQIKDIASFFKKVKENYDTRILNETENEILLIFEHPMIKNEFIKSCKVFYPNPLEEVVNDTQHLMVNEPIYSIFGDNVLIGTLCDEHKIQFGKEIYLPSEFRKFHWNFLPKELKNEYKKSGFNDCKIKRNEEFINFFQYY